ncbi:MAG: efflux RND transporter permease subunit [Rikenellaceae bacterium]
MGKFFISKPIFAISIAIVLVLLGMISISNLSIEQYPDITPPVVEVTAIYDGADAETVNNTVATPIAQSVMGVSNLLYMQTTSANDGTMTLQALFEIGTDPDMDAILTQNQLSTATSSLPVSVTEQGIETQKTMPNFLMIYALYGDGRYDGEFLTNYAYINLQNELLKISGVSKVDIMGAGEYAMRVWVDPERVKYYDLSLSQITSAIEVQGGVYPAGKFGSEPNANSPTFTYTVTLPPQIKTAEEFGNIIIITRDQTGEVVRLRDLATIEFGSETYDVISMCGDSPSAMIMIYQTPGSNAIDVGNEVKRAIAKLTRRLPDGVEFATVIDTTQSVMAGIEDIFKTLLIALALVIFIIYLFLQSIRATIIPLIAIPVSLVGAFILFPVMGFSINIISLLGLVLAIGLVVDDAIVVVEAVQVNIAKGLPPKRAAEEAMRSVTSPIVATTIVLLAVFVPVSLIGGVSGELFEQFAAIISLSVVISAFNALTLSPALSAMLLCSEEPRTKGFFGWFNRTFGRSMEGYSSTIQRIVGKGVRTAIFLGVVIVAIVVLWRALPGGFLPEEDQGYVMVMVKTNENTALGRTNETMAQIDEVIKQLPEVDLTCYASGFNMIAGVASTSNGVIFVKLVDYSDRNKSASQIADELNGELYMGVSSAQSYAFIPPAIPGLGLVSGVTLEVQDLEGRGEEYLFAQTEALMDTLRRSPKISSVTTQYSHGVPQRELVVDIDHAMNLGVDLGQLYTELGAYLGSAYINNFNRFGRLYQVYIQASPEFREDSRALENFYIQSRSGEQIPVSSFVSVRDVTGVEYVSQFNLYRSISLTVMPSAKASSTDVMNAITSIADGSLPPDIAIAWSGVSFQQAEASKSGNLIYVVILCFVFLVLSALYNSWSLPLSILFSVPIAVLGALAFAYGAHLLNALYVNDVYMQISIIIIIALSAKNAILVVEYANQMFFEERMTLRDSAITAARLRVRPILMTAFAFVLGVMPLVFASGVYATARNIIGVALVGGMGVATIFGIFLYPTLYYVVARVAKFDALREKMDRDEMDREKMDQDKMDQDKIDKEEAL